MIYAPDLTPVSTPKYTVRTKLSAFSRTPFHFLQIAVKKELNQCEVNIAPMQYWVSFTWYQLVVPTHCWSYLYITVGSVDQNYHLSGASSLY